MSAQLAIDAVGPEPTPELAQWFTRPELAHDLVALASVLLDDAHMRRRPLRVLEPSAGRGNLVRAVLERYPSAHVDAIELHPRWHDDLETAGAHVEICNYLERPAPATRYDLAVTNPPYDGGEEAAHLEKLLDETHRILALLPARSLHGLDRYQRIWKRFDPTNPARQWWVRQKVHCVSRPNFGGTGGGTDEIVLLDLRRRVPGGCKVRWR